MTIKVTAVYENMAELKLND